MHSTLDRSHDARGVETGDGGGSDDPGPSDQRPPDEPGPAPVRHEVHLVLSDTTRRLADEQILWLMDRLRRAIELLVQTGEVRVRFLDDQSMIEAHAIYCGEEGSTDVITFDLGDGAAACGGNPLDADVMICMSEAMRQSAERGHPVEQELLLYAIHGVLHCLGYDDHDEEGYRAMHEREDEILAAIGVGPTFGSTGAEGDGSVPDE